MPGFEIGGIDVAVEPKFTGFRGKVRENLVEEERHAHFEATAEPKLSTGFKRELNRLVREAATGIHTDVEARPVLQSGFKRELVRLVREASVGVNMQIEASPVLAEGFRRRLTEMVQRSATGIALNIEAKPKLAEGFRASLREELKRLSAGNKVEVEVTSQLKEGFRAGLRTQVERSVKGLKMAVEATPKLETGFRKTLDALLKKGKANTFLVYAEPRLAPGFRAKLRKLATGNAAAFPVTVEITAEAPRDIRRKLVEAIRAATASPPLVARVKIEPDLTDLHRKTQNALKSVSSQAKLRPGVDSNTLRHRLISDVTQMMAAANKIAHLNVVATIRTVGQKGLSLIESSFRSITRLGRITAVGLTAVAGALAGVGTAGLKTAADLEQSQRGFEIQLQSVQKGQQIFNSLVEEAKKTPFEFPDLTPLTNQLIQVDRLSKSLSFDQIIPTLKSLTDLGAAINLQPAALNRFALALTKIAGRGKITGLELRSITNNIPQLNAIGLIAKDLGVSIPEAFDKISAGAVDSNRAIRVLLAGVKNFPGAAGAAAKIAAETFKGALSNLPDILRLDFFQAMQDTLPELTKIIGPDGPLVQAFQDAVPGLAKAFVPLAGTVLSGISDFSTAITNLVQSVVPIFLQLGRVTETVGLQAQRAFQDMGPGLRDLGKSFATLLAGISPVLPLIGQFVSLAANQLSQVIDNLISGGAVDIIVSLFQGLQGALKGLLPIVGQVATEVGGALLKALQSIDLNELGKALGDLVTAGGDLLVALTPLIPVIAHVAAIFAESLAPAVESSIPLITALITIITPLAEALARLGPTVIILGLVLKGALALGQGVATITKFVAALENLKRTRVEVFKAGAGGEGEDKLLSFDGTKVIGALHAVVAAAGIAAAGMSAYFAASSNDIVTQIGGITSAVGGITTAFAAGGPIAGGIAVVTTAVGVIFGQIAKHQAEVRAEAEREAALADQIQQSFKITGVDSVGAKIIGIVDAMNKLVDPSSGKQGAGARDFFGRFNANLSQAATLLATDRKAYQDYASTVINARVNDALDGNKDALKAFANELSTGAHNAQRDLSGLANSVRNIGPQFGSVQAFLEDVFNQFAKTGDLDRFRERLLNAGVAADKVSQSVKLLRDDTRKAFAAAAGGVFGIHLDKSVLDAIRQQQQLDQVQELLKTDTERVTEAFTGFSDAISQTADDLRAYNDAQNGDAQSANEAILNTIDSGKQLLDIQNQLRDGQISQAEATARTSQLIADTTKQNQQQVGRALLESNGDYSKFKKNLDGLRYQTLLGLTQSFEAAGLSEDDARQKALDFVNQTLAIPDKTKYNLETDLARQNGELYKFLHGLDLLNTKKLKEIEINVRANLTTVDKSGNQHIGRVNLGLQAGQNAEGKLVRRPELSWVGEDGPELILPLNDPARMAELVKEAQRAGLLKTDALLAAGGPPSLSPPPVNVPQVGLNMKPAIDEAGGKKFTEKAGEVIADLGDRMVKATDPGLGRWQDKVGAHLDSVHAKLTSFGAKAAASMTQTTGNLTSIATTGSAGVVAALRTGLNTGTATVATIVRGYAKTLANSLNPVLGAIGQPKIDVSKFARGGVNDPRIVPDGSYQVHVFGERGTHGEAYIPFDPKLRSNSRAIADETVRRLGGKAMWFRGGGVTGKTEGLNPEFLRRLERWSLQVGSTYTVNSGLRSMDEQRRLYQRYLAGVPGQAKAAPPGASMHNFGLASDGNRWGALRPGDFGLVFRVPGEAWHVEPLEARTWARQGMADAVTISPIAKPPGVGRTGALGIVAKKAMEFSYEQGLAWAARQVISSPGGSIAFSGGGANRDAAARATRLAMALTGVPDSWFGPLMTLFGRESGYDPLAINLWDANARAGHPSKGLGQMIDSTFLAHALPGHTNIFSALDNAAAVIEYIRARYGDVFHVQQANANRPPRGYENGSIVYREEVARVAERNKPEVIIPLTKPARARELAQQSGLTRMLDGEGYSGPKTVVEKVEVNVKPPDAASPDAYAASMFNRAQPAIRTAIEAAVG